MTVTLQVPSAASTCALTRETWLKLRNVSGAGSVPYADAAGASVIVNSAAVIEIDSRVMASSFVSARYARSDAAFNVLKRHLTGS